MENVPNHAAESDFPIAWLWEENGNELDGTFVEIDQGPTIYGEKPIVVLLVAGEKRSLWLLETALRNQFKDEVAKRATGEFTVGERIAVRRGGTRVSATGNSYRSFQTRFVDRPKRTAAEILGSPGPVEPEAADEDQIPY